MNTLIQSPEVNCTTPLLELRELRTQFILGNDVASAVDGMSISIRSGEALGIVGESGSGKSVTALTVMRLLSGRHALSGKVLFAGNDILEMDDQQLRALRGADVSMIFQDPMTSLNPVMKISTQLIEGMRAHGRFTDREAESRALELLKRMGIASPERVMAGYPHELSGGMRQRVMLAIGFANKPQLIIADEPTTALDVTVQAQILELLKEVSSESGTAVLLISHDLGVIANVCTRIVVMYGGEVVEEGSTRDILQSPLHPYTLALLNAAPNLESDPTLDKHLPSIGGMPPDILNMPRGCRFADRCVFKVAQCSTHPDLLAVGNGRMSRCWVTQRGEPLVQKQPVSSLLASKPLSSLQDVTAAGTVLEVVGLVKHFEVRSKELFGRNQIFRAVDGVDFFVRRGEMVGLVGESGCGKSTIARLLTRIHTPTAGSIRFEGQDISNASPAEMRPLRRRMQMIFQDPYASLNPRMTVAQILREPIVFHGLASSSSDADQQVAALLDKVGLSPKSLRKYPHEFSGGQRQRIGIARALAVRPELIIADEPIAALDVNIQAQIINLLLDLQQEMGLTCLFIAHDLAVVRHISDRILVMYLGVIVESGTAFELFNRPLHPYTKSLISAIPVHDGNLKRPDRIRLKGELVTSMSAAKGCRFSARCPNAQPICSESIPVMTELLPGRQAACHFAMELL